MKYASYYRAKDSPFEIDEYNLYYPASEDKYDTLLEFCTSNLDKRINLWWDGEYNFSKIKSLYRIHQHLILRVHKSNLQEVTKIVNEELPFFLDYSIPIHSYSMLEWVYQVKPKEIYLADDLLHDLPNIAKECHRRGIGLRIVLNRLPVTEAIGRTLYSSPMFFPQDYSLLNLYFDTAEFDLTASGDLFCEYALDENWKVKEKLLYKIWFETHEFGDNIGYINDDVYEKYDCKLIPKELNEYKIKCKHRCRALSEDYSCYKCKRFLERAEVK